MTDTLRSEARQLIQQAVEAELADFLAQFADQRDERGRSAVVRNGYQPKREVLTGVGPVTVSDPSCPKGLDHSVTPLETPPRVSNWNAGLQKSH